MKNVCIFAASSYFIIRYLWNPWVVPLNQLPPPNVINHNKAAKVSTNTLIKECILSAAVQSYHRVRSGPVVWSCGSSCPRKNAVQILIQLTTVTWKSLKGSNLVCWGCWWLSMSHCTLVTFFFLLWLINFLAWRQVVRNDAWRKIEQSTWDLNAEWVCLKKPARVLYKMPRMRPYYTLYLVWVDCVKKLCDLLHYTFRKFCTGFFCSKSISFLSLFFFSPTEL